MRKPLIDGCAANRTGDKPYGNVWPNFNNLKPERTTRTNSGDRFIEVNGITRWHPLVRLIQSKHLRVCALVMWFNHSSARHVRLADEKK